MSAPGSDEAPLAPALFLAHGAPTLALEQDEFTRAARHFGAGLTDVSAIVIMSAHWQARGEVRVNCVNKPEPIYDFGGFSDELYRVRYDAPGAPGLASEIVNLLDDAGLGGDLEESRGWDHGVWVPLLHLRPEADLPVVEISQPYPTTPAALMRIGAALAPLRRRGIVLVGSGGIVHNLARVDFQGGKTAEPRTWARDFDNWVFDRVKMRQYDALANYAEHAPYARDAVPTPEHLQPLFFILGAATGADRLVPIYDDITYGTLSMRSFALV
jgi:4,5-DOPA dioxygenase extradiol